MSGVEIRAVEADWEEIEKLPPKLKATDRLYYRNRRLEASPEAPGATP
ncbi:MULTISPECIES: hypothetical protein [Pyrobaculum]|uniref:Uncharacterized protein n=1 Tax=Pyrobaculum arsenaticum TaxID=121277 RepID=A0A7L4PAC6_9CREN|nr:hypothetical protein [Pyrobaculum arsenaticum]NYR15919.1 hypothetical protein [Pyrobaculum arsenaticum]